ncbi:MAG: efflux transporter outer membrane subunit [Nevskiaceae bacterium]|nr:MAG: efflux transporter outer membrane subunit [Nevskiaceae bacterium]TBR72221.1 MAG: efflux transporter outer membrane subunit [Nevskiaceae bacterium]
MSQRQYVTTEPGAFQRIPRALFVAFAVIVAGLGGCTAGPDFHAPAPPEDNAYTIPQATPAVHTSGIAGTQGQQFIAGAAVPRDWWRLFHSSAVDALVAQALVRNPGLKAAQAAVRAAHETMLAQLGTFYPALSATASASRQQAAETLAPFPNFPAVPQEFLYNLFTPQVQVSYSPDLFGAGRRTHESLQAQAQGARFEMLATRTTLESNVVVTAIEVASLRAQEDATRRLVALERQSLAVMELRARKGDASLLDIAAQRSQLAQAQAQLPPLAKQRAVTEHALATLLGVGPNPPPGTDLDLHDLRLPTQLPVSLPSRLVAQRPDILQARANLHAASAAIGIAAAERFPDITLTANLGNTALEIAHLFSSGSGVWGITASLTAPIFAGGALAHQEQAAKAAYVAAAQQYRTTVLGAFQNVADVLSALNEDARALQTADDAERAAHTTLHLARLELRFGRVSTLEVLTAQQGYQQAVTALVQARTSRYTDTAALYQAIGGWWQAPRQAGNT